MTKRENTFFLGFIIRPAMYVGFEEKSTIISFIHGYEQGYKKSEFINLLRNHFEDRLSIKYDSPGWPGQIQKYADKKGLSWVRVFKQEGLEVLASEEAGGLNIESKKILKTSISFLVNNIGSDPKYIFTLDWIERWNSICTSKSDWFKDLWNEEEYKAIKSITRQINKPAFQNSQPLKATDNLLKQKTKYAL